MLEAKSGVYPCVRDWCASGSVPGPPGVSLWYEAGVLWVGREGSVGLQACPRPPVLWPRAGR